MPNIKPISDLRNYTEVLKEVRENQPVYLTRNSRGAYAIVDIYRMHWTVIQRNRKKMRPTGG